MTNEAMFVNGDCELYVTGELSISGTAQIVMGDGSSLRLYVGGTNAVIGGNGVLNNGDASRFIYYGLSSNTQFTLSGPNTFTGCIYAPNAHVGFAGGGAIGLDFIGANVSRSVSLFGSVRFHYDEALRNIATLVF